MKLPDFEYARPANLGEALALLSEPDARALAGGQSLLPIMAFRLAAPSKLVDLADLADLRGITITADTIRLGATVRWNEIETHAGLKEAFPLLPEAISHVAHYQIKTRGTVGGSLAHADPASEFCGIAAVCDATIHLASKGGQRIIPASELFVGALQTSIKDGELITMVEFKRQSAARRWAFQEFARRRGDYALAGVAVHFDVAGGQFADMHIGVIGASDRPHRLHRAETALNGKSADASSIAAAVAAAREEVQPFKDVHATADYRRSLVGTLIERALISALN
jgi:carbon-monoxide dehydrogenase medium subunit